MRMYWCKCARNRNFGDVLGPRLLEHFGASVAWAPADGSEIVLVGSILEHLPERYTGTVAGIGVAHPSTRRDLTAARVVALRGPLTRNQVELDGPEPLLADPGLIAPDLLDERPDPIHDVGAIGHYADRTFDPPAGAHRIDITAPIEQVIAEAASCRRIYTSSLHGLILADALGLPRFWARYPKVQGGGYKFHDYAAAIGQPVEPGQWQTAPAATIASKQRQLREVLQACAR